MTEKRKLRKKEVLPLNIQEPFRKTKVRKMKKTEKTELQPLNDSFQDAEWIEEGEGIVGHLSDSQDYDYYETYFGNHTVGLVTVEPQGDYAIDVQLYDEYENRLGYVYGERGQLIRLRIPLKTGRNFYIRVTLSESIPTGKTARYVLKCDKMMDIVEETNDPNEDFYDAQRIRVNDTVLGWIDEKYDWDTYEIIPRESGIMRIKLQPSDEHMRVDLYVFDEYEDLIDKDGGLSGRQAELEIDVRAGRSYYIEASIRSDYVRGLQYVLHTEMVGVGGGGGSWPYSDFYTNIMTTMGREDFRYISTDASNIKSQIINSNIGDCDYLGISGGFFHADNGYDSPPTGGASIHWNKGGLDNQKFNYKGKPSTQTPRSTGTLVTYKEGGVTKALITQISNVDEIKAKFGTIDVQTVIGGASLHLNLSNADWETKVFGTGGELAGGTPQGGLGPLMDARRSGIGFKVENGKWTIFMVVSIEMNGCSLFALRDAFKELGCYEAIMLDGSASVQSRYKVPELGILADRGNKGPFRENRMIWNMIRLINEN